MIAQTVCAALVRRRIHYAWLVAALVFLNAIFSAAALGVPAVLIAPMARDLGLTVGDLSAPQGLRFALFGLVARETGSGLVPFFLDGIAGVPALNQDDGIHPNEEGARRAAAAMWRSLRPVLVDRGTTGG